MLFITAVCARQILLTTSATHRPTNVQGLWPILVSIICFGVKRISAIKVIVNIVFGGKLVLCSVMLLLYF